MNTILWIVIAVVLAIIAWRRQRVPSQKLNLLLIVLALTSLGVAVVEFCRPPKDVTDQIARIDRVYEAVGFELGHAVAQAVPQGGDVLVLLNGLPAKFPEDGIAGAEVKGLKAGLGRENLHAIPVDFTPASDDEAMEVRTEWPRRGVPFEKINEWYAAHHGAVAVVAFTIVGNGPRGTQPSQIPPMFVLGAPVMEGWMDWVKPGSLEAVARNHSAFSWETAAAQVSLTEVFRNCCELITPANVAEAKSHSGGDAS